MGNKSDSSVASSTVSTKIDLVVFVNRRYLLPQSRHCRRELGQRPERHPHHQEPRRRRSCRLGSGVHPGRTAVPGVESGWLLGRLADRGVHPGRTGPLVQVMPLGITE
jgi:hypothetical protein